ncbi:hypothetical protein MA16_Dca016647 [Dendrobium catenatum]|uniref:Secreted protein n=1 Tax=Dendrobium catenatum TaxID=906689 RepID=A0A2I0WB69_9ASPA|nr:hypothetical protein MA16_Dca016647 [Dendrobium catenatum]
MERDWRFWTALLMLACASRGTKGEGGAIRLSHACPSRTKKRESERAGERKRKQGLQAFGPSRSSDMSRTSVSLGRRVLHIQFSLTAETLPSCKLFLGAETK